MRLDGQVPGRGMCPCSAAPGLSVEATATVSDT